MLIVDAANIAPGGTLVLLEELYGAAVARGMPIRLLVRSSVADRFAERHVIRYDRFPLGRARHLRELVAATGAQTVLHFGNLATLRPLPGVSQHAYFHNLNIVFPGGGGSNGWRQRLKNRAMGAWMRAVRRHVAVTYVQTGLVADLLGARLGIRRDRIAVRPFYVTPPRAPSSGSGYDFVYPASYYPHKNFELLLDALASLASSRGVRPTVCLISDAHPALEAAVAACNRAGALVTRVGPLPHAECLRVLAEARALVFPSLLESYGLPLIEAACMGKPILCSDLPYAHAVVVPSMTFDPSDVDSVADKLHEFLRLGATASRLISRDQRHQLLSDLVDQR